MQCFSQSVLQPSGSSIVVTSILILSSSYLRFSLARPAPLNSPVLAEVCAFLVFARQNRTSISTRGLTHARKQLMLGRVTVSLTLVAAIFVASERSTTASCIRPDTPSHKACTPACCAKKPCCETSQQRTQDPVPFATTNSPQKNFVALTAGVPTARVTQPHATEISDFDLSEHSRHSPETLALLCIRLI